MGIKDALKKIKPQEQSCCSVEIEENKESKKENTSKDQQNNKGCC